MVVKLDEFVAENFDNVYEKNTSRVHFRVRKATKPELIFNIKIQTAFPTTC